MVFCAVRTNWGDVIFVEVFSDNLLEFILIISPEIMVGEDYGYGAYGEYNYSIDRVKAIMNDYLGIENYNWNNEFTGFTGIYAESLLGYKLIKTNLYK